MNSVGSQEREEMRVELKYCERCGGLWLRTPGSEGVHCDGCRIRLAAMPCARELPIATASSRKPRLPGSAPVRKLPAPARIDHLQGVAVMEVRA